MLKIRKVTSLLLTVIMLFSTMSVFATAKDNHLKDMTKEYNTETYLTEEILEKNNYIIIDSEEKARDIAEQDRIKLEKQRKEDLSSIPQDVIDKFEEFAIENEEETKISPKLLNSQENLEGQLDSFLKQNKLTNKNYSEEKFIEDFKNFYQKDNSKYKAFSKNDSQLEEHLRVLRRTWTEERILDFFQVNFFPIAHDMFLHSLTRNPKNLYYQTEGARFHPDLIEFGTMDLSGRFRYELIKARFYEDLVKPFANKSSTPLNKDGFHYEFNEGDLYWSIHGTHNIRLNRMSYGKAYFRIWDVYDFAGYLDKFLGFTTETSTYGITVEGLYHNYPR